MTPATEPGAYILITSYAGFKGEGQLLEGLYNRGLKGKRIHKTLEAYQRRWPVHVLESHPETAVAVRGRGKKYYRC